MLWVLLSPSSFKQSGSHSFSPKSKRSTLPVVLGGPFELVSRVSNVGYGGL